MSEKFSRNNKVAKIVITFEVTLDRVETHVVSTGPDGSVAHESVDRYLLPGQAKLLVNHLIDCAEQKFKSRKLREDKPKK